MDVRRHLGVWDPFGLARVRVRGGGWAWACMPDLGGNPVETGDNVGHERANVKHGQRSSGDEI